MISKIFQLAAVVAPSDALLELNLQMNGPRMQWGRMPQIALQLFVIFNQVEIFYQKKNTLWMTWTSFFNQRNNQRNNILWLTYASLAMSFFTASTMDSEQTILSKYGYEFYQEGTKIICFDLKKGLVGKIKMFPFCFVSIIFRLFTFSLTVSLLRYISIPLYFLLILGSIIFYRRMNPNSSSFVMGGTKAIFTMGK